MSDWAFQVDTDDRAAVWVVVVPNGSEVGRLPLVRRDDWWADPALRALCRDWLEREES